MQRIAPHPKDITVHLIGAAMTAVLLVGCSADEGPAGGFTPVPTPVPVPVPVPVPTPNGPAPTITFTATPSTVAPGGTTTLAYQANNATGCAASGAWMGDKPTSGSDNVTAPVAPGSYTYSLTCTNATGQQTTEYVTVTVTGPANDPGAITGDPNDGTTPTTVTDDGTEIPGNFICTASARTYGPNPVTEVRVNGLVGSQLTDLLNLLGAGTVTQLQNSVLGKELVVDGSLNTAAQYNLSVGLLGGAISSIDLFTGLNSPAPIGKQAVFLVSFPIATAELSLLQSITVSTFLGTQAQETTEIDASTLDLAGQVATGDTLRFVGLKATLPYDGVTISLSPTLISANVGNAMNVHELCTDGYYIPTPP